MEPIDVQALLAYFNQQIPTLNPNMDYNQAAGLIPQNNIFQPIPAPTTGLPSVVTNPIGAPVQTNQTPLNLTFDVNNLGVNNSQRTLESFLPDFSEGELFNYGGKSYKRTASGWEEVTGGDGGSKTQPFNFMDYLSAYNPYSTDMQTDFYNLGSFLGTPKGTKGRGLGIASSATAAGLGALRTTLSGLANSKSANRTAQNAREAMARRLYTPQSQYGNQNNTGGNPF